MERKMTSPIEMNPKVKTFSQQPNHFSPSGKSPLDGERSESTWQLISRIIKAICDSLFCCLKERNPTRKLSESPRAESTTFKELTEGATPLETFLLDPTPRPQIVNKSVRCPTPSLDELLKELRRPLPKRPYFEEVPDDDKMPIQNDAVPMKISEGSDDNFFSIQVYPDYL